MMQRSKRSRVPAHTGVIDSATLYLCRQGRQWVVIMESPRVTGALPLGHAGHDSSDAQCELLATARRACPDATLMSTDGALTSADYEWRVEVRGIAMRPGDLGLALHSELSTESGGDDSAAPRRLGGRCHWGMAPAFSGRPRTF